MEDNYANRLDGPNRPKSTLAEAIDRRIAFLQDQITILQKTKNLFGDKANEMSHRDIASAIGSCF